MGQKGIVQNAPSFPPYFLPFDGLCSFGEKYMKKEMIDLKNRIRVEDK